jgi:hypothetical protein
VTCKGRGLTTLDQLGQHFYTQRKMPTQRRRIAYNSDVRSGPDVNVAVSFSIRSMACKWESPDRLFRHDRQGDSHFIRRLSQASVLRLELVKSPSLLLDRSNGHKTGLDHPVCDNWLQYLHDAVWASWAFVGLPVFSASGGTCPMFVGSGGLRSLISLVTRSSHIEGGQDLCVRGL